MITARPLEEPTAKNPVISPNFLVWKFCGKAQFPHCAFPQNLHTRKLGEITGFFAVTQLLGRWYAVLIDIKNTAKCFCNTDTDSFDTFVVVTLV